MHSLSTFGAKTSHMQTRIHKIHHGPNLGEATTFPPYNILFSTRPTSKWLFVSGFPSESPEIAKFGTLAVSEPHNFVCRPSIEVQSKTKLHLLSRTFHRYVTHHLHIRRLGRFPTFSGWESNYQFDSRSFFWP